MLLLRQFLEALKHVAFGLLVIIGSAAVLVIFALRPTTVIVLLAILIWLWLFE